MGIEYARWSTTNDMDINPGPDDITQSRWWFMMKIIFIAFDAADGRQLRSYDDANQEYMVYPNLEMLP